MVDGNGDESVSAEAGRRVVIVGGGFGGLSAARGLRRAPVDVTVVDRRNYHLFQPLLYQVATAALSPADIAWPIRSILRGQANARVIMDEVRGVDAEGRRLELVAGSLGWDYLVLATGARHAYFGHDEWAPWAPGLKQIADATAIRRRLLLAFERAEAAHDAVARRSLMTFVVIGGGPTGVELAGSIGELAFKTLVHEFRYIDTRRARVVLLEGGPRLLPSFSAASSDYARKALERLGIEVRLDSPATACGAEGVTVGEELLEAATLIWAAGVEASGAAGWLGADSDRAGRAIVAANLEVPTLKNVFVIGDTAAASDEGRQLPGIAPVAKQQGRYVAKLITARVTGLRDPPPFRYRDAGQLATIGRRAGVIDYRRLRLTGRIAWWVWGIAHIYFLINMRSRLSVALEWLWSYFTYQRGARLIVDDK